jgi:5,10-methylenetetrahydrofolate reductase
MAKVTERCAETDEIVFVCDVSPPRGADEALLARAGNLDADFLSLAYNPGKAVRVNAALAARWVKTNTARDVIFTVATRDMNKLAAQSLLVGAALIGLENVVVLAGDPFTEKELESVSTVDDFTPTELLRSLRQLKEGIDYRGRKLAPPVTLCAGATLDLSREPGAEVQLARRKVEAGAEFFLVQALFDPLRVEELLSRYAELYGEPLTLPLFCGVQVLAPDGVIFSDVPRSVTEQLERGRSGVEIAVELIARFAEQGFRSIYLVPPIFRGGRRDYEAAQRVIEAARG